ncbi:MAG: ABC transporter ATP-binding protein [Oscillospiraceae bacterium]
MSNTILSLSDVTMQFGGVVAVDNLSLNVNEGEIVALIGPNGAGKTTAFNVITGVYEPTNGAVFFNGKPIIANHPKGKMKKLYAGQNADKYTNAKTPVKEKSEEDDKKLKKSIVRTPDKITALGIARTFQNIRLFKDLSVLENVMIAKHLHLKANVLSATFRVNFKEEQRLREESLALLRLVGLEDAQNDIASSLPYGKQRHLEIARALATNPTMLLLDEPAAGMNPQETLELSEFIKKIKNEFKLSVLMIEHHMDLVMAIADRIYVLDFGKLIANGTVDAVQNDPRVIEAYLGVSEDA